MRHSRWNFEANGITIFGWGGSSKTTTEPWKQQKPYLIKGMEEGARLYEEQPTLQYYGGKAIAGFDPLQIEAQKAAELRARGGSALTAGGMVGDVFRPGAASVLAQETLGGKYLGDQNPYLNQMWGQGQKDITQAFQQAIGGIGSSAQLAGGMGGGRQGVAQGIASRGLAEALGKTYTGIYAPAYEAERGRQMQMIPMAQSLAAEQYTDIGRLSAVGEEQQRMEQAIIDELRRKFEFEQLAKWQGLGLYQQAISGDYGGTVRT